MRKNGFESSWRSAEHGFTLVEMLIALAIFGMITAAGVALLTLTVRTQATSDRLLDAIGALRRTGALLNADLAQAAPRRWRDANGQPHPAFTGGGGADGALLTLVRRGADEAEDARDPVRRVEYRLDGGRLERLSYGAVDGDPPAVTAPLLDGVRSARLRYRDRRGEWHESWDPTDPAQLPAAVELVVDSAGEGLVRQLFLVGSGR
jgi:general secretion pathway protein J